MNVLDIAEFYTRPLGKITQELIARKIGAPLQAKPDQLVLGLGYAVPYLVAGGRSISFMMARSGVVRWPQNAPARAALVDELDLPLGDSSVDLALLVHALEFSESAEDMLAEAWRVLHPQGRMLLVVPNRAGFWSASDASPFGQGQPFSRSQVGALLKEAQFSITRIEHALVLPPWAGPKAARGAEAVAKLGLGRFSGVIVIEAVKQVYAYSRGKLVRRALPRLRPVLLQNPQPAAKS
ncbi:MAG: methyltransferase domain-containing protein [Alphaproteobacteria bacterium]|nr:methyltransferase domain-containing protein [Alphaproteobacteria bacterium]